MRFKNIISMAFGPFHRRRGALKGQASGILALLLLFFTFTTAWAGEDFDEQKWFGVLHRIQDMAIQEGISARTINAAIQSSEFVPEIIRRDQNQSEFKLTLREYTDRVVNANRIRDGKAAKKKYPTLLERTHKRFGIQPYVILAFWGMESSYGSFKTPHKISDAFLTLIYDGRRGTFFTNQLMALMRISDKNHLNIEEIYGSWAGAMGHFQFIPTTLEQYGTSGKGGGDVNVMTISDAMASAGNFLKRLGWDQGERIVREIKTPANFDPELCDVNNKRHLNEWRKMGLKGVPQANKQAGLLCDESTLATNTAYLTYENFYRIKRWNNSNAYALAIAILSDKLK